MSTSKSNKLTLATDTSNDQYVDVLYQKLGENWFAFSLIDDEMFMAPITEDKIQEIKNNRPAVDHEAA